MAAELPALASIELGDEGQEAVRGCVNPSRQSGDLLFQRLEGRGIVQGIGDG
jgi:hypothetical protein